VEDVHLNHPARLSGNSGMPTPCLIEWGGRELMKGLPISHLAGHRKEEQRENTKKPFQIERVLVKMEGFNYLAI
jgi:hypothetical protein